MFELALPSLPLAAIVLVVGALLGWTLRGLGTRDRDTNAEEIARNQERERKLTHVERDLAEARGRLTAVLGDAAERERELAELRRQLAARTVEPERLETEPAPSPAAPEAASAPEAPPSDVEEAEPAAPEPEAKPPRQYPARPAAVDDLVAIRGIGKVLAKKLNGLGIYQFRQIAAWTDDDIAFFDAQLEEFHGRIRREGWVESARQEQRKKYGAG